MEPSNCRLGGRGGGASRGMMGGAGELTGLGVRFCGLAGFCVKETGHTRQPRLELPGELESLGWAWVPWPPAQCREATQMRAQESQEPQGCFSKI